MPDEKDKYKSEVSKEEQDTTEVEKPNYSDEEVIYLSGLQKRLEIAQLNRDTTHDEYDGMDYITRYEDEERLANAQIPPRRNKTDTNFISGTIRHKMLALLSAINALNLEPEYTAFDKNDVEIAELGNALNIIRQKADEDDDDEEKKIVRQMELLKHGTVFVEEIWSTEFRKEKDLSAKFTGQKTGINWTTRLEKVFDGPSRNVLDGRSVYLGDIRQPFIKKQPYLFTVDDMSYEQAKAIYGKWEMWPYVTKKQQSFSAGSRADQGIGFNNWRLLSSTQENRCEIVKYQDKYSNEFQIIINGVPMLPLGFPMPWKYGEYNLAQQNFEFIHPHFAYGRSFVSRLKVQTALLDEMLRLAILKVQKLFMPPRTNQTGRVVSKNVFMPGQITMGLNPDQLKPLTEADSYHGLADEMAVMKQIHESIDENSVNPSFAGQKTQGNPTATEILELQRQAKMVLGLTVFAAAMLEKKLGQLRLYVILENWFEPNDTEVDKARNELRNKYRTATVKRNIDGRGMGNAMVMPTENQGLFPTNKTLQMQASKDIYDHEENEAVPTQRIFLNATEMRKVKCVWRTSVNPTEARGSERNKLLFERMTQQATAMNLPLAPDWLMERFAENWEENPDRMFAKPSQMPANVVSAGINPGGAGPAKLPAPPGMPPKPAM